MRLNPTHPNIDYVLYMRGLTAQALDDSALQGFFSVLIARTVSILSVKSGFQRLLAS